MQQMETLKNTKRTFFDTMIYGTRQGIFALSIGVIAVNPGSLLNTNMVKEAFGRFWSPADKGANILYDLAVSANYQGVTGKYFDNDNGGFGKAHADAYNESVIEKLIETTDHILAQ